MIRLQPEEQKSLAQYVYSLCAITLDESKGYLIESRLAGLVEESGCGELRRTARAGEVRSQPGAGAPHCRRHHHQ